MVSRDGALFSRNRAPKYGGQEVRPICSRGALQPAISGPAALVRSRVSVNETNPTPRCSSSWSVAYRSVTDRPQRSRRQTSTRSHLPALSGVQYLLAGFGSRRPGVHLADLQGDPPATPCCILTHGSQLHRKKYLVWGKSAPCLHEMAS